MIMLARGIEDDHFWVVRELDGVLVETPWRIERETDGYRLGHADDADWSQFGYELGAFETPNEAIERLQAFV
ncbi:hypothetical protein NVV95_11215 [Herbiconiux sp. CPCC 205716]|uniref:Uncharacterized protein n=1 Tax=Herbiconiux gentiana TaxID=2970912 RepID=A0ABT2GFX2_9MICO|nr:hypothetical protein [Herbiconiux gentiana]MCS5715121.1 hypothetical protein [Herbiconiux gentiana]